MTTTKTKTSDIESRIASATVPQLEELHSGMLATASDLGYEPPAETLVEISDESQGREVCLRLHAALEEHRERQAKKPLADGDSRSETGAGSKKKETTQEKIARQRAAREKRDAENAAKEPQQPKQKKEKKTVAKTAKKAAKPAKKSAAKKSASKKESTGRMGKFRPDQIINWKGDKEGGLGARKGSGRAERRQQVKAYSGKTVAKYIAAGGKAATLVNCVAAKLASVA